MKTTITVGLSIALSLLVSGSAQADRYEVGIGGGTHFVPMESMDAVSEEMSFGIVSLHAGIKVPELAILTGFETEVVVDWDFGALGGQTFNRIEADLEVDALMARARLRRSIRGPFSAFADAGMGLQWASLRLVDEFSSTARPLTGDAKALLTSIGGGAEVRLVNHESFRFGLRVQLNYQAATSMRFDATPMKSGDDKLEIATQSAALGSINTSGLVFRGGLVGSF